MAQKMLAHLKARPINHILYSLLFMKVASVALIVTDLNLVLLLYYFIIAYVTLP